MLYTNQLKDGMKKKIAEEIVCDLTVQHNTDGLANENDWTTLSGPRQI